MIGRRSLLLGLLAAPAIVKVASLMPVRRPPLVTASNYLRHVVVVPKTLTPGAVSIKVGDGEAITLFAGGPVASLVPFLIPVGMMLNGPLDLDIGRDVGAVASLDAGAHGSILVGDVSAI